RPSSNSTARGRGRLSTSIRKTIRGGGSPTSLFAEPANGFPKFPGSLEAVFGIAGDGLEEKLGDVVGEAGPGDAGVLGGGVHAAQGSLQGLVAGFPGERAGEQFHGRVPR